MKQTTCSAIGGPAECNHVITGATAQEIIDSGWKHVQEAHPELSAKIMANSKEENDKWMEEFKTTIFPNLTDAGSTEEVVA